MINRITYWQNMVSQTEREKKVMDDGLWEYGGMTSSFDQRACHLLGALGMPECKCDNIRAECQVMTN